MEHKLFENEYKDFKSKLSKAFRELRKAGYFARQNFWCCQSCGWNAVPDGTEKAVFYHNQDNENIEDGFVHLAWAGKGSEIRKALKGAGLRVEWNGKPNQRIKAVYIGGQND